MYIELVHLILYFLIFGILVSCITIKITKELINDQWARNAYNKNKIRAKLESSTRLYKVVDLFNPKSYEHFINILDIHELSTVLNCIFLQDQKDKTEDKIKTLNIITKKLEDIKGINEDFNNKKES